MFAFYGGAALVVESWGAFFFGHGGFGVGVEGGEMGDWSSAVGVLEAFGGARCDKAYRWSAVGRW